MDQLIESLRAVVGANALLTTREELLVYECDGLPQHKHLPRAVVFPQSTEETAEVMRTLARFKVPFTPRGAGTGLSGGALALNNGVVIELARMRKILNIDQENRIAVVQTGVVNLHVSRAVAHLGLHYIPDPSSQPSCTIGGNIAENAGGIHCLKYGTTTDHVLAARVVLSDGEILDLSSGETGRPGYDLLGVFIGSEGTFGIATEATLRLTPVPSAVRTLLAEFGEVDDASHAVSAIIAAGVMPAALEMMDREIIRAIEASIFAAGLPLDAGAALLIELDGIEAGIDDEAEQVSNICLQHSARNCRLACDENERKKLWAARKGAFGAIGRIAPDSMIQDAVVPRSRLPEVLRQSYRIAAKYHLILANVFHAGDGNLHPLICFDSRSPDEVRRVREAGRELMETCVRAGGSITGEHGVGLDKRDYLPLIFSEDDMAAMLSVRRAFDPGGLCNPGKIIPVLRGCGEARAVSSRAVGGSREPQEFLLALRETDTQTVGDNGHDIGATVSASPDIARDSSFDPKAATKQLSQIVGDENISQSAHPDILPAPITVTPGSVEEICAIMKLASSEGWKVMPSGARTWLSAGNPLTRVDVILSMQRLDRILEHEPADLVATAEAGVTLRYFNAELARGGQWLPLDPPGDGRATLGGVVSTGSSGAQKFGYGPPRRFVIGMKVVLADGRAIKAGGRVVKNVAGYDLCKLFTGSYGTLGVITELTFKLRPLPAEIRTVVASGPLEHLTTGARAILAARLLPVAVELLSPSLSFELEFTDKPDAHLLLVRFAGAQKSVAHQLELASALLQNQSAVNAGPLADDDAIVWNQLAALTTRFADTLTWRAGVSPSRLPNFLARMEHGSMWQAGIGTGSIRAYERLTGPASAELQRLERLRAEIESGGGWLVIENAPAEIKSQTDAWGSLGSSVDLMKRIKHELDCRGILSPGRFGAAV